MGAIAVLNLVFRIADFFNGLKSISFIFLNLLSILLVKFQWWRDVVREGWLEGSHSNEVYNGLKLGIILFITSEIFFFVSFFWAFFHSRLSPDVIIGSSWPPLGTKRFNPIGIPILNTLILISSGVTITWRHHALLNSNKKQSNLSIFLTWILGLIFLNFQILEYIIAPFSISDSIYGSTFFIATGFHGLHVFIGILFLFVCNIRIITNQFSSRHHFGFEAAAWYWHFVDVVWIYLYLFVYWWKF